MKKITKISSKTKKVYIENSVIGGYFDEDQKIPSRKLFELFRKGVYIPIISDHVIGELLKGAPDFVIANYRNDKLYQIFCNR